MTAVIAAGMFSAPVNAAGLFTAFMVVTVMIAVCLRIIRQFSLQQGGYRFVRVSVHAGIQRDPRLRERCLCACADTAADKDIRSRIAEQTRQSPVSPAVCADDPCSRYRTVPDLIDLELFRMSEVLEHFAVFIGYRYFHT